MTEQGYNGSMEKDSEKNTGVLHMSEQRMQERATVRWLIPILLTIPFLAALIGVAVRFGPLLYEAVSVAVKLVVKP